ncbi:hypothetical protein SRHO_G00328750 [Serrasalmus rhombeus]
MVISSEIQAAVQSGVFCTQLKLQLAKGDWNPNFRCQAGWATCGAPCRGRSASSPAVWNEQEEVEERKEAGLKGPPPLRSLASRSRESFRRFSLRSQQRLSLRRRATPSSPATPSTPSSEQVKQSGHEEPKDTDTLVQETDSQYGTWDTGLRTDDSLTPATPSSDGNLTPSPRKPTPTHTPEDATPADTPTSPAPSAEEPPEPFSFPETPTALLDSSALRSRAQLSKRLSRRAPPSRNARHSAALAQLTEGSAAGGEEWRYRDSTEDKTDSKPQEDEESDSEEQVRDPRMSSSSSASSQPQRVSLFPGMDPSALMAQLKKRGDGETQPDGPVPSSSQLSRSPKSPFLPRAARVLPPAGGKENGEASSPQWLKELKTKKRLSQYENDS